MPVLRMVRQRARRQSIVVAGARQDQERRKAAQLARAKAGKPLATSDVVQEHASLTLLIQALARELARQDHARAVAAPEQHGD